MRHIMAQLAKETCNTVKGDSLRRVQLSGLWSAYYCCSRHNPTINLMDIMITMSVTDGQMAE